MATRLTDGVVGARVADLAGVHAAVVVADLSVSALAVSCAFNIVTFNFWVSVIVWWTVANRLVTDNFADGATATVAGFHALLAQASFFISTLRVGLASNHNGGRRDTKDPGVSSPAWRASANRLVNINLTESIVSAWILQYARISAVVIDACLVHWAFGIVRTDWIQW